MLFSTRVSGQSTYLDQIIPLFATKCFGSSCHSPANTQPLVKLIDSTVNGPANIYNNIVNKAPLNFESAQNGFKLVAPFKPDSSTMYRKLNCNRLILPVATPMTTAEGDCMPGENDLANPDTSLFLSLAELKLVRGWILCGAPQTGVIDAGCITGIFDNELPSADLKIYPNPFTNSFSVDYTVEKAGDVELVLLNVLGQELTTLLDKRQEQGKYNYDFEPVETKLPGIYFIKFSIDGKFTSRKIVRLD
jgi:hypothetical protein